MPGPAEHFGHPRAALCKLLACREQRQILYSGVILRNNTTGGGRMFGGSRPRVPGRCFRISHFKNTNDQIMGGGPIKGRVITRTLFGLPALLFMFLFSSLPASANATYVSTGNPLNSCGCAIDETITLTAPLGDNLSDVVVTPLSFSISDGSLGDVLNPNNSSLVFLQLSTDATGNITEWDWDATTGEGILIASTNDPADFFVR